MADLQCVICDFTVEPENTGDELMTLLGAGVSQSAGEELLAHMESHTLLDWVKAFKMADAYIAQLEAKVEALETAPMPAFQTNPIAMLPPDRGPAPPSFSSPDWTPAEQARMTRQDQIRQIVETHDHNQTLIPRIPDAQRPEGVVGVKY